MRIASGVTDQVLYFVAVDSTDLKTRKTGLTGFTVYRSRNGAAAVAMTTPTVTEVDATNMAGVYKLLLDEDMTIGAGNLTEEIVYHITVAAMAGVTRTIELFNTANYVVGTVSVNSDMRGTNGANTTVPDNTSIAAILVDTADMQPRVAAVEIATNELQTNQGNWLTATGFSTHTAANVRTEMDANSTQLNKIVNAEILQSATAQGGTANTITLSASTPSIADDLIAHTRIYITSGTGQFQSKTIDSYVNATKVANLSAGDTWAVIPDATSKYELKEGAAVHVNNITPSALTGITNELDANSTKLTDINADTNEIQTDWVATTGRLDILLGRLITELDSARNEPAQGTPSVNAKVGEKIDYLYKAWRNKTSQNATTMLIYDNAGTTIDHKLTVSDDGTTAIRGAVITGI